MTFEEMKRKKEELGLTSEMIARASGIPVSTVQKFFGGFTRAPRKLTLTAIEEVIVREDAKRQRLMEQLRDRDTGMVCEPSAFAAQAQREKKYTLEDYYALPEDVRAELIDGVIYNMTAPSVNHQRILGELYLLFRECADRHGMPCEVLFAPCDVHLDRDPYTMVQPDLLVSCGEKDEESEQRYEGAPDLTVEILSPSTRSKDQLLKLYKYQNAGVREYWIVDPKFRIVTVHYFESEDYAPKRYTFEDKIPVEISGGTCEIDFSRVSRRVPPAKQKSQK